jgi:predicted TIM-barrel fold metal-dependent hydrolase
MIIARRTFLGTLAAATTLADIFAQPESAEWGGSILDCHLHLRADGEANIVHMDGCGVTHAVILARDAGRARALQQKHASRLTWAISVDVTQADAEMRLREAARGGAVGFGELKSHVEADGPELQRVYALAGELGVPVLVHFQEVEHFPGEGLWGTGFKRFEGMLRKYPKTRFIGHADAFWANVDATYANEVSYPTGPVVRGGVTDKLLGDYENLFGDLSANSGNNALSRDADFTADFLRRHQDKLIFGSDCSCTDGHGNGVSQANNPAATRLAGKCVARETLGLLKGRTAPEVFTKLTWANGRKVYGLSAL